MQACVCYFRKNLWWHLKKKVFCPNGLKWNIEYTVFQLEGTYSDHQILLS